MHKTTVLGLIFLVSVLATVLTPDAIAAWTWWVAFFTALNGLGNALELKWKENSDDKANGS
jgi:hypothetical protein